MNDATKWYNCAYCDAGYPDQQCTCKRKMYAFIDSDGDIRETFSENMNLDYLFELQYIKQKYDSVYWTLHKIDVTIGEEIKENIDISTRKK